jgi:hypothetical protein
MVLKRFTNLGLVARDRPDPRPETEEDGEEAEGEEKWDVITENLGPIGRSVRR